MNTATEPKTLDQAQRIYTLTEFIKRIRIKTSAGESIEPELAQAMHYINEGAETHVPAYAELQAENERLKEALGEHGITTVMALNTYRSRLHGLCQGPEPHTAEEAAEQIRGRMAMYRNKIADLESQLAEARQRVVAISRDYESRLREVLDPVVQAKMLQPPAPIYITQELAAANEKLADERLFIRGLQEQLAGGGEAVAEIVRRAIIEMAEEGWLHFGSEGMTPAQEKLLAAYELLSTTTQEGK